MFFSSVLDNAATVSPQLMTILGLLRQIDHSAVPSRYESSPLRQTIGKVLDLV